VRRLNIHKVSSQRPLRAAVIGAGVFGRHHATKYLRSPEVKLHAIADPIAEARRHAAKQLHVPVVADWRELLGEVDLVSIFRPPAPTPRSFGHFSRQGLMCSWRSPSPPTSMRLKS